ncbi:cation transporter [Fibrella sp. HMF5335]|uniref:Cation transporter n=1 Tax=Fibrella rubiginis TaxID=2817060 RepID=A0A939K3Y2_9BACT|nr:cation diffusion facilitator family transporter [Fibrella rubiginis]MBO0935606.1 cation transporter [Fibrella rubiginis]
MTLLKQPKTRWMALSLGVSIILLILKFTAFALTNSTAILTDALESIVNVIASAFALYSLYLAGLPRDQNHPYGHGKVEYLSSGFEGALILSAGLVIIYEAVLSFLEPHPLNDLGWGVGLVAFTTAANALLGYALVRQGKKMESAALAADGHHLLIDSVSSIVVVVGVGLVLLTGWLWLDRALALVLALFIIYNGWSLVRQSVGRLLDETDAPTIDRVVTVLNADRQPNWIDVHNLRVQKYGADLHIDCHLTLPYYWDLAKTHEEVHRFEETLQTGFASEVEIFVHADPCLQECCHYCHVANCPVRAHEFVRDVIWTAENLPLNQKHFVPM